VDPVTAGAVFVPTGAEGAGGHFPWGAALAASDVDQDEDELDQEPVDEDDGWSGSETPVTL
jgi:hypothetical protein